MIDEYSKAALDVAYRLRGITFSHLFVVIGTDLEGFVQHGLIGDHATAGHMYSHTSCRNGHALAEIFELPKLVAGTPAIVVVTDYDFVSGPDGAKCIELDPPPGRKNNTGYTIPCDIGFGAYKAPQPS